jgi:hypoxanthine phosphoribosyltransferase
VLLDRDALGVHTARLAREIEDDHPDGVVLVAVLKGALVFSSDLAREIRDVPVVLDYLGISRYAPDSGRVRILKDLDLEVAGRDVVVVEDLVDTGLTLAYLLSHLRARGPRRLDVCTLLDRPDRRIVPLEPRYVGAMIPGDAFVVGYGLHVGERFRNLPFVVEADREALLDVPEAGLAWYEAPPTG